MSDIEIIFKSDAVKLYKQKLPKGTEYGWGWYQGEDAAFLDLAEHIEQLQSENESLKKQNQMLMDLYGIDTTILKFHSELKAENGKLEESIDGFIDEMAELEEEILALKARECEIKAEGIREAVKELEYEAWSTIERRCLLEYADDLVK